MINAVRPRSEYNGFSCRPCGWLFSSQELYYSNLPRTTSVSHTHSGSLCCVYAKFVA